MKYLADNQQKWMEMINEKVDIPNIDEAKEAEILNAQYDVLEKILGDVIEEF